MVQAFSTHVLVERFQGEEKQNLDFVIVEKTTVPWRI